MYLNEEQKRMGSGELGEPKRIAMEMLCALGEIYGADRLIPVKSAHCAGLSFKSHGIAGMKWAEAMAEKGARVVIPTTMNVIGIDRSRDLGISADWAKYQMRIEKAYEAMGCYGTSSCVPYFYGFLPRFGEHIAWAESSAVVFTNSVLGARDNREGGPSAWAAGITGYTPHYGLHLDENRTGDVLFKITTQPQNIADYGALGNFVGKITGERIPVFENLGTPSVEELVYLGAAMASSGGVAMFHGIGLTPEARDIKQAFGSKAYDVIEIGENEIAQGYENLTSAKCREVDFVALGCPHCTLNQIREIAKLLDGKKIKDGVRLWIHTSLPIKKMAEQFGYRNIIEEAGGILTQDLCTILSAPEQLGVKTLATHSAKMAFYAPGSCGLNTWYGSEEQCIIAALTGRWDF